MQNIVTVARVAGMALSSRTMEGVGHGFPAAEQSRVKAWLVGVSERAE